MTLRIISDSQLLQAILWKGVIALKGKLTNVLGILGIAAGIASTILGYVDQKNEIARAVTEAVKQELKNK